MRVRMCLCCLAALPALCPTLRTTLTDLTCALLTVVVCMNLIGLDCNHVRGPFPCLAGLGVEQAKSAPLPLVVAGSALAMMTASMVPASPASACATPATTANTATPVRLSLGTASPASAPHRRSVGPPVVRRAASARTVNASATTGFYVPCATSGAPPRALLTTSCETTTPWCARHRLFARVVLRVPVSATVGR